MAAGTRLFHLSAALWLAALASAALAQAQIQPPGQGQGPAQVNTIKEAFQKLYGASLQRFALPYPDIAT